MKILLFAEVYYPDVMGGGEYSTKQVTEGLASRGHDVTVYCLGQKDSRENINGVCVKRRYIPKLSEHFLSNAKNIDLDEPLSKFGKIARKWGDLYPDQKWYEYYTGIILKEKPDAVHTASPMSYLGRYNLWKAAFDLKVPVSHVCRGPNLLELKFFGGVLDSYNRRRNAFASKYLTALAAPSKYMLMAHNQVGICGQRFNDVIYNAIDFAPTLVSKEFVNQKKNLVIYAGELRKEKGITTLVDAVKHMDGVELLLVGRGPLSESIERCDRIQVLDWLERESLYEYIKKAKVLILPSEWNEPFGRTIIEAIGNGTLAIGSDKGGIPEVLDDSKDYIFKSGHSEELRHLMEGVVNMPADTYLKEILSFQKSLLRFSEDTYIDNWERFFLQQIG